MIKKNDSRIAIVIGTKAELIKCMPLMLELKKLGKSYWFIHTGQHPLGKSCEEFKIKKPDFVLSKEPSISTKFWSRVDKNSILWCFLMIFKIKKIIKKIKPKYLVYHGDTMSTAVAAIASSKMLNLNKKWKNVHLEAGLRSGSLIEPFPEEISRKISDFFSDILFSVSDLTEKNLKKYKQKKSVIQVGNTIVDSCSIIYKKKNFLKTKPPRKEYALINIHRHENLKNKKRLEKIIQIINSVGISSIWPMHHSTKSYLEKYGLIKKIEDNKKIQIIPLMDYKNFIFLIANSKYLITDGGSIQEESLVFKKPCLILRKVTERSEGLNTGINFLTFLDVERSKDYIKKIEDGNLNKKNFKNPYGIKGVSKRILKILK